MSKNLENKHVKLFRDALIIKYNLINLEMNKDNDFLKHYFDFCLLDENSIEYFHSQSTIEYIIGALGNSIDNIVNHQLENLIKIIDCDLVPNDLLSSFIIKYFKNKEYFYTLHRSLFLLSTSKLPPILIELTKVRLKVDPFSAQVDFSQWLIDTKKYEFIVSIIKEQKVEGKKVIAYIEKYKMIKEYLNPH